MELTRVAEAAVRTVNMSVKLLGFIMKSQKMDMTAERAIRRRYLSMCFETHCMWCDLRRQFVTTTMYL